MIENLFAIKGCDHVNIDGVKNTSVNDVRFDLEKGKLYLTIENQVWDAELFSLYLKILDNYVKGNEQTYGAEISTTSLDMDMEESSFNIGVKLLFSPQEDFNLNISQTSVTETKMRFMVLSIQ